MQRQVRKHCIRRLAAPKSVFLKYLGARWELALRISATERHHQAPLLPPRELLTPTEPPATRPVRFGEQARRRRVSSVRTSQGAQWCSNVP